MDDRYAAGLFDGEGYIRIARWNKPGSIHVRYQVFGGIGMTFYPVIQMLQDTYGGSINQNRHDLRNGNHRIQFTWTISSQGAATFLRRVLPFLVVKKEESQIALLLQQHIDDLPYKPGGTGIRPDRDQVLAYREDLYQRISSLKKRSFPPLTE